MTRLLALGLLLLAVLVADPALANLPAITVVEEEGQTQYSLTLQILALMTALTLLPSLLLMMTSFA
ncbi:MAG: flagellar biosynthetic protein FliP, partial [Halothiobacillaceae bacterium]